jgi:WD40 repeat protein
MLIATLGGAGCAGTKPRMTGGGGSGGTFGGMPPINGLESLTVTPANATVPLTAGAGGVLLGEQQFTATGVVFGASMNVTNMVSWSSNLTGATVSNGLARATAPGVYGITASSGGIQASGQLEATFSGPLLDPAFDPAKKGVLDGAASGTTQMVYPVDKALFPGNLTPIYAQISASGANAVARLNFQGQGLDIQWYGNCEAGPGGGCYVKMPLTLTRLFVAASEKADIRMTARVLNSGATAPTESQTINVAWAGVNLSGGLYYWTTIDQNSAIAPGYTPADANPCGAATPIGTGILRYDFSQGEPAPQLVWTDRGAPPAFSGSAQSLVGSTYGSHCLGCHAITNDGKYMALTLGGSSSRDGANWSMLDISGRALQIINPTSTNLVTDKLRMEGFGAETAWGPIDAANPSTYRMVNMLRSKLYLSTVTVNGTSATPTRVSPTPIMPSWPEYATDPFWSKDGSLFAFTSFASPSIGMYNDDGLNGDMKRGGAIAFATADMAGIHDDAKFLTTRDAATTSYYPNISGDNKLVVFNRSTCGADPDPVRLPPSGCGPNYGNQTCDGYDDGTAKLWVVAAAAGATAKVLANANGPGDVDNSWPRFSPDSGTFRGDLIYWIAFSSRRAYGMQVNSGVAVQNTKPQLWVAAVRTGENIVGDPSWGAVWLPAQNINQSVPSGNHVPQWVKIAVKIE